MSRHKRSPASSMALVNTRCGAGTSAGLTRPLARIAYHRARINSQGASISALRRSRDGLELRGRIWSAGFLLAWRSLRHS